ncbi:hypothetical protein N9L68_01790 [bacterium]|nr:hypothetical protein [bacterium]
MLEIGWGVRARRKDGLPKAEELLSGALFVGSVGEAKNWEPLLPVSGENLFGVGHDFSSTRLEAVKREAAVEGAPQFGGRFERGQGGPSAF